MVQGGAENGHLVENALCGVAMSNVFIPANFDIVGFDISINTNVIATPILYLYTVDI
ncbi:MAG: hypothetical protein QGH37_23730 [Candidatus Poribacteria bacterium]|nr:hypothetical protein [Candidatus Poribacteria bacterium]